MVDVADSKSAAGDSVPVRVRSPAPRRSKLCIACSDFFQKSERTHSAAPPFQPRPACAGLASDDENSLDLDCIGAPIRTGRLLPPCSYLETATDENPSECNTPVGCCLFPARREQHHYFLRRRKCKSSPVTGTKKRERQKPLSFSLCGRMTRTHLNTTTR